MFVAYIFEILPAAIFNSNVENSLCFPFDFFRFCFDFSFLYMYFDQVFLC